MAKKSLLSSLLSILLTALPLQHAFAQEQAPGLATPWQLGSIAAATPVREQLESLTMDVHYVITAIVILVLGLMGYIILRFNHRANPVARKFSHNTLIEIIWTTIPILILIGIAIPSLRLHYFIDREIEADMTLKVTGHQWYWSYAYPDNGNIEFDSYIKKDPENPSQPKPEELQPGEPRLLAVDNPVVVPVDTNIRVIVTGADVIHSWAVPAFGIKRDAVPGRLNETWFKATRTGTFYGQCSELCGTGHGFMPIEVKVVSKEEFSQWVNSKKQAAGIDVPHALVAEK